MILQILLLILKIIGIILLVVLCLALLLLFYPIKYIGKGNVKDKIATYNAKLWWLFHVIHISLEGENENGRVLVRVFGIPVYRKAFHHEEVQEELETSKKKEEKTTVITQNEYTKGEGPINTVTGKVDETDAAEEKISFTEKIKNVLNKIKEFIQTIRDMYSSTQEKASEAKKKINDTKKLLKAKTTKRAYLYVKEMLIKLLKHIRPGKVGGELNFGMEQPDQTGQILGYVSIAAAMFHIPLYKMNINPNFEKKVLDGYISAKGKFLLGVVLVYLLKVYFNRDVKRVMKKLGK